MTTSFVGHHRETRPVSEITTATVLMIQKRRSTTVTFTKIDTALPLRVTDKTPHHNTYHSTSSCMGGMFCFVTPELSHDTAAAATSTNQISAAGCFWTKEG